MAERGVPLPKFGEWDVNDPASAEGFTVIFNKARDEKKTGGKPDSPTKDDSTFKPRHGDGEVLAKTQSFSSEEDGVSCMNIEKKWFCCLRAES